MNTFHYYYYYYYNYYNIIFITHWLLLLLKYFYQSHACFVYYKIKKFIQGHFFLL